MTQTDCAKKIKNANASENQKWVNHSAVYSISVSSFAKENNLKLVWPFGIYKISEDKMWSVHPSSLSFAEQTCQHHGAITAF